MATKIHYRTCNLCEAMCGIEIHTVSDEITKICGDAKDPLSKGYICPKAAALKDIYEDPDRLRYPVKKSLKGWEKISWKQAFKEVTSNLKKIQKNDGNDAVSLYLGNPTVHNYGSIFGLLFTKSLHTKNRYSASTVDQIPHHLVGLKMFGHSLLLPIPDVDNTDFFLVMGANPVVSNGSIMSAPNIKKRIKNIQNRGGKVVVIDPVRTQTAQIADKHYYIKPGSDVFLLLSMLNIIFENDWNAPLKDFYKNLELLRDALSSYHPKKMAIQIGISEEDIYQLAFDFCQAKSAVCYGRLGVSVQEFGTLSQWLITVLNIVTGNFDESGGAMFTRPAFDVVQLARNEGKFDSWKSRVRQLPEFNGEIPVATLADEMEVPGEGQIKALITIAGNPVLSTPNGNRLQQAIEKLDYVVAIDFYINETTCNADIILPPTHALERDNYDFVFLALAVRNFTKYSPALFSKKKDMLHDWEIFRELHIKMQAKGIFGWCRALMWRFLYAFISPYTIVDIAMRLGPYGKMWKGLSLKKVKKSIHGLDLGALQSCLPQRLMTKDKKVDLAPDIFIKDLERVSQKQEMEEISDFLLIGRRHLRSNNSWMHNCKKLISGSNNCTLWIHPKDAEGLQIKNGDSVNVCSRVGKITIHVEISNDIMPGVVSIPHGWGHKRSGIEMQVAQQSPGVSVNDITDEWAIDVLSGNAILNGVPVQIERCL